MRRSLLYELDAKISKSIDFGGAADGSRSDVYLEGEVQGRITGKFRGVDYGLARGSAKGGAVVIHVHETIATKIGLISVLRRGYAVPAGRRYRVRAFCLFQTGSEELKFLNSTVAFAEGFADSKTVRLSVYELL